MSDFDTLCKQLEAMDTETFTEIFNELSVEVINEMAKITLDGGDALESYLQFILATVAADGKLSEEEFELLKPIFDMITEEDTTYQEGVSIFKNMGLDSPDAYKEIIDTMVDVIGLVSEKTKDDIIMLCLLVCAIDGEVTQKEKEWIAQLALPLTIDVTPMEYIDAFLTKAQVFTLATTDGDQPRMRILGLKLNLDDKIYFGVGTFKDVYKQLKANPKCEILASVGMDFLRWDGKAVFSDDPRLLPMLKAVMPELAQMYFDMGWSFGFFTLEGGSAEVVNVSNQKIKIF
ncbi:pyridoxamine 5'-phosphate oxidase family protein [Methanomassiliicoccales archaeon LGM-RCC1]|nr:pyridoxamine 5'-phosphate oxidase family protein [Methanomassiliicoccales archaeon LGM-RCC1]